MKKEYEVQKKSERRITFQNEPCDDGRRTIEKIPERVKAEEDRSQKTITSGNPGKVRATDHPAKVKYPAWGARRIKHQFNLPCSWRTVHRILKKHGLLIRIKAKPQPAGKRFQRRHVDSMWQGDTFQFRIRGVGKVYITGFTDDYSRYRVKSKVHLRKDAASAVNALQWALRAGRIPREIYLDNGKQFVSKKFKAEATEHGIKLIFGRPYNPRGRGKIERYHQTLYRELIALNEFRSLGHFRKELWRFDLQYNNWRKQEILDWMTPASVYSNKSNFNKNRKCLASGHKLCQQIGH